MDVVPFEAVGPLALGSSRSVTRALLGEPEPGTSFRRSAWGERLSDCYFERGLILNFDRHDVLDEIEVFGVCRPVLDGVDLLGLPSEDVADAVRERGLELDLGSLTVPAWGLGFYATGWDEDPFTSVTFWTRGWVPTSEPVFFGAGVDVDRDAFRVVRGFGFPGARLGMPAAEIREVLGEGMSAVTGRGCLDVFFSPRVTVFYDDEGLARRICVMEEGASAADGLAVVGMARATCREQLRAAGVEIVETEGEIRLVGEGVSLNFSRTGDDALAVSSISVGDG